MTLIEKTFEAPWGTMLKVISAVVTLVLLGIFGGIAVSDRISNRVTALLYIAIPILTIFISLLFTVRGYVIIGNSLLIRRLLWNTDINISMLESAEFDPKAMSGSIRTFGNGGLYGFSGKYRSGKLGSFKAYVTDFKNCVIIRTAEQTIVVSPLNPEYFVETLLNSN